MVDLSAGPMAHTVALVVAQEPAPPAGKEEFGKASPVGLVVILLLGLATVLLIRSMTKHLRKVPASFDEPSAGSSEEIARPGGATPDVEASPDR